MKKTYIITMIILVFILSGCGKQKDNFETELKDLKTSLAKQQLTIDQLSKEVTELRSKQDKPGKHVDKPDMVEPLYKYSVVSNDIDFIKDTDPDAFQSIKFIGNDSIEMPDSRSDHLFDSGAYVFEASFIDGSSIEIWCHSSFGSEDAALEYAEKLSPRLGKLPEVQRKVIDHVVIHKGDAAAFAENAGHFFVLYSENMDDRISTHDLEETVFHESVHAALQQTYETTTEWNKAQAADGNYITEYALKLPHLEDMPESALFAYTYIKYPGRMPEEIEKWVEDHIPNRVEFFKEIYK